MRRHAALGGPAAGPSPLMRLDPFHLPVRYVAGRSGNSGSEDSILLERDRVVLRRRLPSGIPAVLAVPVSAYRGIAVRMVQIGEDAIQVVVELMHEDPGLSVPLTVAEDPEEIAADWQAWGKVLGLPLLLVDLKGEVRQALAAGERMETRRTLPRRAPWAFVSRRPSFLRHRAPGHGGAMPRIAGREIIAPE